MSERAGLSLIRTDPAVHTFQLLADWRRFATVALQYKPATIRTYTHYLLDFQTFLLPRVLANATENDVLAYLAAFDGKGSAPALATRAMKSFYQWATEGGVIPTNPVERLRVKKSREGPAPYLSREEVTRLVIAIAARGPGGVGFCCSC
jgi:site-specific recombinase XerD